MLAITEALAELKTIAKRIEKKHQFIGENIGRLEMNKDPLEKDGGSVSAIQREFQAILDLQERSVRIRAAIAAANTANTITVEGETRTIADWLVWRREIAPGEQKYLGVIRQSIAGIRNEAKKRDAKVLAGSESGEAKDVIIHISESELAKEIEHMETVLGTLDGQLSLKNATIVVNV